MCIRDSYWSDCVVSDPDGDGINNSAYSIDGGAGAQDYRPLIEPWNNYTLVKCGDAGGDGRVGVSDGLKIIRGEPVASRWASDVNCDGRVGVSDGLKIIRGKPLTCCICCSC